MRYWHALLDELWNEENEPDHDRRDHRGSDWTAQGKSTMVYRFVEE